MVTGAYSTELEAVHIIPFQCQCVYNYYVSFTLVCELHCVCFYQLVYRQGVSVDVNETQNGFFAEPWVNECMDNLDIWIDPKVSHFGV